MAGRGLWVRLSTYIGVAVHAQTLNLFNNLGLRVALCAVSCTVHAFDFATHVFEQVLCQGLAGQLRPICVGGHDCVLLGFRVSLRACLVTGLRRYVSEVVNLPCSNLVQDAKVREGACRGVCD